MAFAAGTPLLDSCNVKTESRRQVIASVIVTAGVITLVATAGMAVQRWQLFPDLLVTEVGLIFAPAMLAARWQGRGADLFSSGTLRPADVPQLLAFGVAAFFGAVIVGAIVVGGLRAFGVHLPPANPLGHLLGNRSVAAVTGALLAAVVLAPVCEETLFRGLLQPALARIMPAWAAIGFSAAAFGVLHLSPTRFAPTFVAGVVAGIARVRFHSVWAAVAVHMIVNALGVTLALLAAKLRG